MAFDEEIFGEEMVLSNEECNSLKDKNDPSGYDFTLGSIGSWVVTALNVGLFFPF